MLRILKNVTYSNPSEPDGEGTLFSQMAINPDQIAHIWGVDIDKPFGYLTEIQLINGTRLSVSLSFEDVLKVICGNKL
ncbi:MAG: hypothetical protein E6R04_08750 [Spirochaetes bacterium]|nr:MAG: hypothetical protein E6R04_08750 [Spirochaetota bacterium]